MADSMRRLLAATSTIDPRFEHVSIVHVRRDSLAPVVATSALAEAMATGQIAGDTGCVSEAIRTGLPVIVTATDRSVRFPAVQEIACALGVSLQLAVPLLRGSYAVGALSVYSRTEAEVDLSLLELAEALAAQAALLIEQDLLVDDLKVGMATRQQIGQACGILMSRFLLDGEEAFEAIRRASQNRNVKVRDLALEVVRTGTLTELDDRQPA